jgi:hypothetical protein
VAAAQFDLDTVKATLECARADVAAEDERMQVLDGKLSNLATLAGLSVSISASLGANVLAAGALCTGFTIALGAVLTIAAALLLKTVLVAFDGLRPKPYRGLTRKSAIARVTPKRLSQPGPEAMATLAATYYVDILPAARVSNDVKLEKVADAFVYAKGGLIALVGAVILTAIGAVV